MIVHLFLEFKELSFLEFIEFPFAVISWDCFGCLEILLDLRMDSIEVGFDKIKAW